MSLQEEHDEYVKSLQIDRQQSEQNDPKIWSLDRIGKSDVPATAESIKQEAEAPIHTAAELLLLRGKMKYAAAGNRFLRSEENRNKKFPFRTGEHINIKSKAAVEDVFNNYDNKSTAYGPSFIRQKPLPGTNPVDTSRQIPKYAQSAKIYLGDQPPISTFMTTTGGEPPNDEQLDLNFEGVGDDIVPFQESARIKRERNPEGLTVKQILENNRKGIYKFSNPQIQRHLRLAGVNDAGIFLMENWENTAYPGATRPKPRTGAAAVQRPGVTQETFNEAKEHHWQTWLTYFSHKGLSKGDVRLHHVATLKGTIPLYEGIEIGGKEWKDLDIKLQKLGVWPGHDSRNYELMTDANHNALHRYTDLTIGPSGEVFFTPERMAKIRGSEAGRLAVATEYAGLVNDSKRMMMSIQEQYELMNSGKPVDPDVVYRVLELGMQTRELMNETDFESPGFTEHLRGSIQLAERDMRLIKLANSKKGWSDLQKQLYRDYLLDSPLPYIREDYAPEYNPNLPPKRKPAKTNQGKKLLQRLLKESKKDNIWQLELDLLYPDD